MKPSNRSAPFARAADCALSGSGGVAASQMRMNSETVSPRTARSFKGEFLRAATIVNTMIKQLGIFTSEVIRVAREVGTDGKLGGQAIVPGVAGTWKDLTDSVNAMCGNLTDQVRSIAAVTTAVAHGVFPNDNSHDDG